ncbi:DUF5977 domain-containing protein [Chryseobacterium arthrosphaerae]|uniref:DUF5977 domain-containing protein n=1 Tax=Chryseobacterium arthrosphaerae TaxID=651561 RepID=UPI001F4B1485|nr:DUF5977 domain-containing protein [Chryseobacterium arthrosphaerae]MDG4654582.1 DUF5977 domain-containing protein [Chryseobacterium arthrosphaerae]
MSIKKIGWAVIFLSAGLSAQISGPFANNTMFLSPEVSAFQKYNLHDINLYTGKINLTIPIYEIKTGNISIPVAISYNSGGIKIDDIASNVGLGWSLSAGGSTIRTIKDMEDNNIINSMGNGGRVIAELGYLASPTDVLPPNSTQNEIYTSSAKIDASPDLFTAIAPGISAKFYLSNLNRGNPHDFENNVSTYHINFIDGSAAKGNTVTKKRLTNILPANGFTKSEVLGIFENTQLPWGTFPMDYEKFELTNAQGTKYTFDSPDVYETVPSYISSSDLVRMTEGPDGISLIKKNFALVKAKAMGQYKERVSAWNLTKIEDPTSNRNVLFTYQKYNKPDIMKMRTSVNTVLMDDAPPFGGSSSSTSQLCGYGFVQNYLVPRDGIVLPDECLVKNSFMYSKYPQTNRIEQVKWDNGTVKFYYDLNRQDAVNEKALTKIEVIVNNKLINTYIFNYSYFTSKENCGGWECKRLKLDNIDIMGAEETQAKRYYTFEYDYTHPLPKVNSLQQDFLGYYNNHGVELPPIDMHIHPQIQKSPTLYFERGKQEYSITPFSGGQTIPGDYSLEANEYSLTGLLKKVINPLGGFTEFEYENHDFKHSMLGKQKAGGARIKTQIINDGIKERHIYYEYKDKYGNSSGNLAGMPVYGFPIGYDPGKGLFNPNTSFAVYSSSKGNIELTDNSYIGYTRVVVKEEGKGFKENIFSYHEYEKPVRTNGNPGDRCGTYLHNSSAFGNINPINRDILNGKILEEKTFNEEGNLIKESLYNYKNDIFQEITIPFQNNIFHPVGGPAIFDNSFEPRLSSTTTFKYNNKLRIERNVLVERVDKEYFGNTVLETKNNITYDDIFPFIKKNKVTYSDTSSKETIHTYPFEVNNQLLIKANMLSTPLITVNYLNKNGVTKKISHKENIFNKNAGTSNLILPTSTTSYNLDNLPRTDISYDKYDDKGNLLQYTTADNISSVIIWGYKQSLPLVKIDGATYQQVMQKFGLDASSNQSYLDLDIVKKSDLDVDVSSEENLKTALKNFRTVLKQPDSQIATYTHNPGIGITSISKQNNMEEKYKYTKDNKLWQIIGNDEKLQKEFEYNSTPQRPQTIFYNRKQEKNFTRNNCPVGYYPGDYNYIVPARSFSSSISLAHANQLALNDIQSNGQNKANMIATCQLMACSFEPNSSFHQVSALVQKVSDTKVKARITIPVAANSGLTWQHGQESLGQIVGKIGGSCKLLTMSNVLGVSENGRFWAVVLAKNGSVFINLKSGTVNPSDIINLDFQYDINDQNAL